MCDASFPPVGIRKQEECQSALQAAACASAIMASVVSMSDIGVDANDLKSIRAQRRQRAGTDQRPEMCLHSQRLATLAAWY
jgi:hypothetical protein